MENYNDILRQRRNELRVNISYAEQAAEDARRCDNDDLADRCYDRIVELSKELKEVEEVCDKFDI